MVMRLERDVEEDLPSRLVGKIDPLEAHRGASRALPEVQRHRIRPVLYLPVLGQQAEHAVHVDERLLDLAVHHAQKIERDVELDQQAVDEHEVAERQSLRHHALSGEDHQQRHSDSDDAALPDVEEAERGFVLDGRRLVFLQVFVVAARLVFLVVEVFHRFVVEQAVDRARVGL